MGSVLACPLCAFSGHLLNACIIERDSVSYRTILVLERRKQVPENKSLIRFCYGTWSWLTLLDDITPQPAATPARTRSCTATQVRTHGRSDLTLATTLGRRVWASTRMVISVLQQPQAALPLQPLTAATEPEPLDCRDAV